MIQLYNLHCSYTLSLKQAPLTCYLVIMISTEKGHDLNLYQSLDTAHKSPVSSCTSCPYSMCLEYFNAGVLCCSFHLHEFSQSLSSTMNLQLPMCS